MSRTSVDGGFKLNRNKKSQSFGEPGWKQGRHSDRLTQQPLSYDVNTYLWMVQANQMFSKWLASAYEQRLPDDPRHNFEGKGLVLDNTNIKVAEVNGLRTRVWLDVTRKKQQK